MIPYTKPIVFLFSGQGSHYYQMGRALFEEHICFKQWMLAGEEIFKLQTSYSLLEQLYANNHHKAHLFNRTLFTHPAIFILQYVLAQTLISEGIIPHIVLGTSLGEFAAAAIAGCMDFETTLKSVILQAQVIEEHCSQAGMIAILTHPSFYKEHAFLFQNSTLASINFHQHFVVTAAIEKLEHIEQCLKAKQIAYQRLAVSHGFHSSLIGAAENPFLKAMQPFTLKKPMLPVVSCAEAKTLPMLAAHHLWEAITNPILFEQTLQDLEKIDNYLYLDVGPSGTLATFAKYNLSANSSSMTLAALTPFAGEINNLMNIKNTLSL